MNVRDNAMHCEAKKHAFRQTQDGVVVSFVLHPQEVPSGLTLAALGTRYMLALVEIGDNDQPVAGAGWRPASRSIANEQRAEQRHPGGDGDPARCVREICGVTSRSQIVPGTGAAATWRILAADYRAWMREPEVI
jgi:hypothetical protein